MNRRLALWTALTALSTPGLAYAQGAAQGEVTIGYQGLPSKPSGETQTGIQVSESALLHVGAGAEAGYDTNVFYSETSASPVGSQIYRASFFADLSNASRTGAMARLTFDARAGVTYRRYQSADPKLDSYRNAWMPTGGLALSSGSGQFGFGLADTYARIEDPPYASGQAAIVRNNNQASIEGRWSPGGGRLTTTLRYTNMIDVFETEELKEANSDTNLLMLDGAWKWLPKTAIIANVQQGYIFYFQDSSTKSNSFPLRVTAGLRGLLTEKTSAILSLGYVNGFYSNGATTNGFLGSTYAELAFTVRPTALSRAVLGYRHDFTNSVISSFSYDETVYASYLQQIAGRLGFDLSGRYVHRNYQGYYLTAADQMAGLSSDRVDNFWQVGATLDYFMRNWIYVGVGYSLYANGSTITAAVPGEATPNADYVKQQVFVRLGLTY